MRQRRGIGNKNRESMRPERLVDARQGEDFLQSGILASASCLITDARMPGMDGIELQRRVRLKRPKLPVIFISAHNDKETRQRALNGGAIDFLYKPFDGANLLETIYRAVMTGE